MKIRLAVPKRPTGGIKSFDASCRNEGWFGDCRTSPSISPNDIDSSLDVMSSQFVEPMESSILRNIKISGENAGERDQLGNKEILQGCRSKVESDSLREESLLFGGGENAIEKLKDEEDNDRMDAELERQLAQSSTLKLSRAEILYFHDHTSPLP